jgi:hypothetical protein
MPGLQATVTAIMVRLSSAVGCVGMGLSLAIVRARKKTGTQAVSDSHSEHSAWRNVKAREKNVRVSVTRPTYFKPMVGAAAGHPPVDMQQFCLFGLMSGVVYYDPPVGWLGDRASLLAYLQCQRLLNTSEKQ